MNRREFFKALVAVGAGAALAESLIEGALAAVSLTGNVPPLIGPQGDVEYEMVKEIHVASVEEKSRVAEWRLRRVNGKGDLYRHCLNAYGGCARLVLPIGGEWVVTRGHQVEIFADLDGAMSVLTETSTGELRQYFWQLSRQSIPTLLRSVVTPKPIFLPSDIDEDALEYDR